MDEKEGSQILSRTQNTRRNVLKTEGFGMIRRVALTAVVVHALVVVAHGIAHAELGVWLSVLQTVYVVVVIAIAPIASSILLWTRLSRSGWLLLTVSMTAALVFGIYWHYVAISPDHVSHLPNGSFAGMFRFTALLLVISEAFGTVVGLWGLTKGEG
jgi:hypothetical protein